MGRFVYAPPSHPGLLVEIDDNGAGWLNVPEGSYIHPRSAIALLNEALAEKRKRESGVGDE